MPIIHVTVGSDSTLFRHKLFKTKFWGDTLGYQRLTNQIYNVLSGDTCCWYLYGTGWPHISYQVYKTCPHPVCSGRLRLLQGYHLALEKGKYVCYINTQFVLICTGHEYLILPISRVCTLILKTEVRILMAKLLIHSTAPICAPALC